MIKSFSKKTAFLFLAAIVAAVPALYVLHHYHVPTWFVRNAPVYAKQIQLKIRPIVVSDHDLFQALIDTSPVKSTVEEALEAGGNSKAWEEYRRMRAAPVPAGRVVDPTTLGALLNILGQRYPKELRKMLSSADEYAADRFAPFGTEPLVLGRDFTWTTFPARDNDAIYIWEVSTLQHLPILAQAYRFTNDPRYLAAVARHLGSWIAENPIDNSVNWLAPMEVSLRLTSLIWAAGLLAGDDKAAALVPDLTKTIYGHARFVAQRMDRPRKKNNHGIFAALGLYLFAANYPEFRESREWKNAAEHRVLEELTLQYTRDGIHKEFAPTYHKTLLDGYLHYLVAKQKLGEPVPADVRDKIRAQAAYLREITGPDNRLFLVGDSDDHHFLRLDSSTYADAGPTLRTSALLFAAPEIVRGTGGADWGPLWLLGQGQYDELSAALSGRRSGQGSPRSSLTVHRDEGIFRVDSNELVLFGGYSRLGAEPQFSGHNHCNITSFLLWKEAEPIAIDPGTYTYRCSLRTDQVVWRDFLRSSRAHNVTTVDGRSQAEPLGDFGYKDLPDARLLFADRVGDFFMIAGQHHAYQDRVGTAFRIFVVNGRTVVVIDWFPENTGTHDFESNLVFGTDRAFLQNNGARLDSGEALYWAANAQGSADLARGSTVPPAGWRSTAYGTLSRTAQFRGSSTITGPAISAMAFDLSGGSRASYDDGRLSVVQLKNNAFCIVIRTSGSPMAVLVNPERDRSIAPAAYKEWATDALVAAVELKENGRAMFYGGTYLQGPAGMSRPHFIATGPMN